MSRTIEQIKEASREACRRYRERLRLLPDDDPKKIERKARRSAWKKYTKEEKDKKDREYYSRTMSLPDSDPRKIKYQKRTSRAHTRYLKNPENLPNIRRTRRGTHRKRQNKSLINSESSYSLQRWTAEEDKLLFSGYSYTQLSLRMDRTYYAVVGRKYALRKSGMIPAKEAIP